MALTAATQTRLATITRSLGTCRECDARHLHVGTIRERNGMVCLCATATLAHFTSDEAKGEAKGAITWRAISGTRTDHPCDEECTSARGARCACVCGGDNHGAAWGMTR